MFHDTSDSTQWLISAMRPELLRRISLEARAIQEKFPGDLRFAFDDCHRPGWTGTVPVEGRDAPITIIYPPAYPAIPPTLKTPLALPPRCPHLLEHSGGWSTLCWIAPGSTRPRSRWNPQRHTAATALRAAQRWFLAYLIWRQLGRWPVPDAWDLAEE